MMCGICGKIYVDTNRQVERRVVEYMAHLLHHRGPDEDGFFIKGNVGLGHKRLSIIDVTHGKQPISNETGTLHILCNGEIYNYRSLRDDLIARGHVFKTRSDTEVILHLYEEEHERCLQKLWGMFAFIIWDEKNQQLFMARDRIGKKPLFYAHLNDRFLFASELKAMLADPAFNREIDYEAIHDFLTYQYVPYPSTVFKQAQKLPPGSYLIFSQGNPRVYRWWELQYEPKRTITFDQAREETLCLIDDAVKIRLESEVPLGVFLSGGVDSSAVVAFMRKHISGELKTFSIGFEVEEFNELPYARRVAGLFETKHHEFVVRPNAIATLPRLVWHFDEPYADSSALPSYYVSEMAKQYVTVALNGDGGDESFCGYTRYKGFRPFEKFKIIPETVRRYLLQPATRSLFAWLQNSAFLEKLFYVNQVSLMNDERRYAQMMIIFRDYMKPLMYGERIESWLKKDSLEIMLAFMRNSLVHEPIDKMTYSDIMTYLAGDLLPKMDRATMAHGVEGRSPFLDHRIMEFAARLPANIRFKDNELKHLLKSALSAILPDDILWRQKKGFGVPISHWFKKDLFAVSRDILLSRSAADRNLFNMQYIKKLLDDHQKGSQNHHHRIWALLNLEVWFRTFIDRKDISSGPITL